MNASINGSLNNFEVAWKAFSHNGKPMTKKQVRKVLEYAKAKGYKTTAELTDAEVDNILQKEDTK